MGWFDERFDSKEGRVRYDCQSCSRPMWFPPSKHGKYVTCGGECASDRYSAAVAVRARQCATCAQTFVPRPAQLRDGVGRFCSQACNTTSHDAMNTKDAQSRARISWRARYESAPFTKCGPEHHSWTGGKLAAYERMKASGRPRIACQNRRRKIGAGKLSPLIAAKLGALQRWKCAICRGPIKGRYELDHIMPLALGGEHSDSNAQLLCRPCNRKKNAKHPIDYMQKLGFLL